MRTIHFVASMVGIAATLASAGCAFDNNIRADAVTYNQVVEDATDKLLVLNILRSRDKAPLHFADIPNIHESFQAAGSVGITDLIGPIGKSTTRSSGVVSAGIQTSPSFDLNTFDTKDFVTGISSPIDPKFVKYWLDRGLDKRIVLLLFFSSAQLTVPVVDTETGEVVENSIIQVDNNPRDTADSQANPDDPKNRPPEYYEPRSCEQRTSFERYLSLANSLRNLFANSYSELRQVVADVSLPPQPEYTADHPSLAAAADFKNYSIFLKNLSAIDPTKYKLVAKKSADGKPTTYSLYQTSSEQKIALCYLTPTGGLKTASTTQETSMAIDKPCFQSSVEVPIESSTKSSAPQELVAAEGGAGAPKEYCSLYKEFGASQYSETLFANAIDAMTKAKVDQRQIKRINGIKRYLFARNDLLSSRATKYSKASQQATALSEEPAKKTEFQQAIAGMNDGVSGAVNRLAWAERVIKRLNVPARPGEVAQMKDKAELDMKALTNAKKELEELESILKAPPDKETQDHVKKLLAAIQNEVSGGDSPRLKFSIRSVGEIISFLGDLTYYQEKVPAGEDHNIPLTLGFSPNRKRVDGKWVVDPPDAQGGVLFTLDNPVSPRNRFQINYRGDVYAVNQYSPGDHTLQVLAILNQLINLNKSATDIRTTPFVEVLP